MRRRLRPVLLVLLALAAPAVATPAQGLADAQAHYRAGRYQEALRAFTAAAAAAPDPRVLYDMGNCAWRLGRPAEAMVHYRRALKRAPRDAEARFNLALAEQKIGIQRPAAQPFLDAARELGEAFTPRELLWITALLECAALALLLFARRRLGGRVAVAVGILLAVGAAGALARATVLAGPPFGVVIADEAQVRSEPRSDLPVTLTLKAGETVQVEERTDRWVRIRHGERSGWAERAAVGVVD